MAGSRNGRRRAPPREMGYGLRVAGLWPLLLGLGTSVFGQVPEVRVYSAFQRIDPTGRVIYADRARRADAGPREILSPGLARNSRTAFHVAVTIPAGTDFTLYVGQNPEGFLGVDMYKQIFVRRDADWVPDGLEPVELPYTGRLPEASRPIVGQTTVVFLMDVAVPSGAEVRRTKLEPELHVNGQWILYPMEVRVVAAVIPERRESGGELGGVDQPSDSAARAALRSYLCGSPPGDFATRGSVRWFLLRDALQDMALARSLESPPGARLLPEILKKLTGESDGKKWCAAPVFPEEVGPEWYLRVRDSLLRMVE
jgi:hypothetical protein